MSILVNPHLVEPILSAVKLMNNLFALVYRNILVVRPCVDRNVLSLLSVPLKKLVLIKNV